MGKILLKESSSIVALSTLIASQVVGLGLSKVARTHGPMLLLDFGRLKPEPLYGKRRYFRGEWTILVEWSDWIVTRPSAPRMTGDSSYDLIDKSLPLLVGQKVAAFAFNAEGRLVVRFQDGASFVALGKGGPRRDRLSLWKISNFAHWYLTRRCDGRFVVNPDGRIA
jgi:hypothetical protein